MSNIRNGMAWMLGAGMLAQYAVAQEAKLTSPPLAVVSTVQPELVAKAVMKEIDDPSSGTCWLLVEDPAHPGGPGRLIAMSVGPVPKSLPGRAEKTSVIKPVIRAGDRVQLEEHSAVVDASLEAIALGSAVPGGLFRARLRVGGRVVAVRALEQGRAELAPAGARQ